MKHLSIFILLLFCVPSMAQTFRATTNAKQVTVGGTFEITYSVDVSRANNFRAPSFNPFRVVSGPNKSVSTSYVNGKSQGKYSERYALQAVKEGEFTLNPARIKVGNRTLTSNKVTIEVIKGNPKKIAEEEGEVFVQAELDSDTAYVGQQVVLDLVLYTQINIERYDLLGEPEFDDIFRIDLPRYRRSAEIKIIEGKQYSTQSLKKIALFPQKTGVYDLSAYRLQLGIPDKNQKPRRSFFSNVNLKKKVVNSNTNKLTVLALPADRPESFSGGVGRYTVKASINDVRMTTDDALTLKLDVTGNGDERNLIASELSLGDDFETYDANNISSKSNPGENEAAFRKVFEYLIIPKKAGRLVLKPHFTYFDPDSAEFITIIPNTFQLYVKQGQEAAAAKTLLKKSKELDLMPNRMDMDSYKKSEPMIASFGGWTLLSLIGIYFLGLIAFRRKQIKIEGLDPAEVRYRKARASAEQRLTAAKVHLEAKDEKAFFEEISYSIKGYLGSKLDLPLTELSRSKIGIVLENHNIPASTNTAILQILNDCELALFASAHIPKMDKIYEQAVDAISELEKALQ